MLLRDGVSQVRVALTELRARYWSDTEIIWYLNQSAKKMCSKAQCLHSFFTFNTHIIPTDTQPAAGYNQEYALPIDVDQIEGIAYFSGTVFPILPAPREAVQLGGRVGGIPWYYYMKKNSRTLTPQVAGGQIISMPIDGENAAQARTIIGLYPVPTSNIPIYIWYTEFHPTLKNPMDIVQIPDMFMEPWMAYAMQKCKEKEGAMADALYWKKMHEEGIEEFTEYMINSEQSVTPPSYTNRPIPPFFLRGSSSVLVVAQTPTM